jgi:DNA-binding GntR family transcriptional regulator
VVQVSVKTVGADGIGPRLAMRVYDTVLARLISQEIRPGQRITVDELSRELGVSQTPMREALAMLESAGLVQKTHLVGYRAAPQLNREQFEQLFDLRLALEPLAASKAAKYQTQEQRARMLASASEMGELAARILQGSEAPPSYSVFAQMDSQLHDLIAESSGNPLLHDSVSRLHAHLQLFRLYKNSEVPSEAIAEHAVLVDAIIASDARSSAAAMRRHLEFSRRRLRAAF